MLHYSTEITSGDFVLRDPVTVVTNIMMFIAGLIAWRRLIRDDVTLRAARLWRWFFAGISIASLIGVIVHGLSAYTPDNVHLSIWLTMGLVQSAGVSGAQLATVEQYWPSKLRLLQGFIIAQLVITTIVLISYQTYTIVKYHLAVGILPIMGWHLYQFVNQKKSGIWIAGGVLVSGITGAVHGYRISLSQWFNYNDISHILVIVSVWMMAKGVLMLNEESR
ncbi:MAG: hypothetical protein MUC87_15810 [Bacteroidia bacterium]|jgi:hypothetical protein|nr:hypothetical protein [Bacteroidia bacterium]